MFTENYVEALLVAPGPADRIWALWDAELIDDDQATQAWCMIAHHGLPAAPDTHSVP